MCGKKYGQKCNVVGSRVSSTRFCVIIIIFFERENSDSGRWLARSSLLLLFFLISLPDTTGNAIDGGWPDRVTWRWEAAAAAAAVCANKIGPAKQTPGDGARVSKLI